MALFRLLDRPPIQRLSVASFLAWRAARVEASAESDCSDSRSGRYRVIGATTVLLIAIAAWVVLRGCEYNPAIPLRYLGYFALQIALPGAIVMYLAQVRPLNVLTLIALGLPTGFAVEIFTFLGLSALHLRSLMPVAPLVWLAVAVLRYRREGRREWSFEFPVGRGVVLAVSALSLFTVLLAAGHMYAESPLVHGLPQRPIFHDWMYLLSRAAVIKHVWPFEEPSLAGTPLQYHYFVLVHVASASLGTGLDTTWILLRLAIIPLGVMLVAQTYLLGKVVSGKPWVGVLSAALMFLPGEMSGAGDYRHLTYLGFFLRWLYVSPTFLFGLVFFAALLAAIATQPRMRGSHLAWIALLAAAGTAAKGSVLPVVLVATAGWLVWQWIAERRCPRNTILIGAILSAAFATVYGATMAAWGAGDARLLPFRLCEISGCWEQHAIPITRFLKHTLHAPDLGTWLGRIITGLWVVAGTAGVRMLAVPFAFARHNSERSAVVQWLAAAAISAALFGLLLHFDSDGEIYFLFLGRLPLAVLAAAAIGTLVTYLRRRHLASSIIATPPWAARIAAVCVLGISASCMVIQIVATIRCETAGWRDWANYSTRTRINDDLLPLYETTHWLRDNTAEQAVLIGNAFTQPNLGRGRGILVDHTTVGVYYYYSALAERRVWVEGPTYLLDEAEARHRLVASARFFYDHQRLRAPPAGPVYVVLDHSVNDSASLAPDVALRVYHNARFEVFRLAAAPTELATTR